jgi:hypothetical protein
MRLAAQRDRCAGEVDLPLTVRADAVALYRRKARRRFEARAVLPLAGERSSQTECVSTAPIRDNDDLWQRVSGLVNSLRAVGSELEAERLHRAMTTSAHPGEVWPETLTVLRGLLASRPPGLDVRSASVCADYLARWP